MGPDSQCEERCFILTPSLVCGSRVVGVIRMVLFLVKAPAGWL